MVILAALNIMTQGIYVARLKYTETMLRDKQQILLGIRAIICTKLMSEWVLVFGNVGD